jgi:hypothetical protein
VLPICPPDHEIVLVDVRSVMAGPPRWVDLAALELAACRRQRAEFEGLGVPTAELDACEARLVQECAEACEARAKRKGPNKRVHWCDHPAQAFELETRAMGFGSHLERLLTMDAVKNATAEIGAGDRKHLPKFQDMPGKLRVVCCP